MDISVVNLSPRQLRRAADVKERIDALNDELARLLGSPVKTGDGAIPRKKRTVNRAARAKMRVAQKARWAKIKGAAQPAKPSPKPKRRMSATAKARLSAIARARWKKARAQGKKTL
jgi:hypothetical protein